MITEGQIGNGRLAHNGSFFVILPHGDVEVGLKLQWGDFDPQDTADMRIVVRPELVTLLRSMGWQGEPFGYGGKYLIDVPEGTTIYILGESDSYWDAQKRGAVLEHTGKPAPDPNSRAAHRHRLPAEAIVLDATYVRAFARGLWKDGAYTGTPWEEQELVQSEWHFNQRSGV